MSYTDCFLSESAEGEVGVAGTVSSLGQTTRTRSTSRGTQTPTEMKRTGLSTQNPKMITTKETLTRLIKRITPHPRLGVLNDSLVWPSVLEKMKIQRKKRLFFEAFAVCPPIYSLKVYG